MLHGFGCIFIPFIDTFPDLCGITSWWDWLLGLFSQTLWSSTDIIQQKEMWLTIVTGCTRTNWFHDNRSETTTFRLFIGDIFFVTLLISTIIILWKSLCRLMTYNPHIIPRIFCFWQYFTLVLKIMVCVACEVRLLHYFSSSEQFASLMDSPLMIEKMFN